MSGFQGPTAFGAPTDPHVQVAARAAAFSRLTILLSGAQWRFRNEIQLQDQIATVLAGDGVDFQREVVIDARSRIDFLITPRIGLEVKVFASGHGNGLAPVTRQLHRYAAWDGIDEIVLATTSLRHRSLLPNRLNGKPVTVIALLGASL